MCASPNASQASHAVRSAFGCVARAQSEHSDPSALCAASPISTHESQPSAPSEGGVSPPAGSCGCSPGLHARHATPSDECRPWPHSVQLVWSVSTSDPALHVSHEVPSVLNRFAPPVSATHSTHAVASKAALG